MVKRSSAKISLDEKIRNDIVQGIFPPGGHLALDKLAKRFKVSTMPIREALRTLEVEGIVHSLPNRGSFVTKFGAKELLDIYDMRATLEELATRHAIPNLKPRHLKEMQEIIDLWGTESGDIMTMVAQNTDFHLILYEAANRPHLSNEISLLRNRTRHYLYAYITKLGRFEQTKAEHQALIDACKQGDVQRAGQLMFEHIWHVGQALAAYVQESAET